MSIVPHRSHVALLLLVVVLTLGSVSAAGPGDAAAATNSTQTTQQTHTLVIMSNGQSGSYTLSVSGQLTVNTSEPVDSVQGQSMSGRVGEIPWDNTFTDKKDTIHFTGRITDYQAQDGLRLRIDGKRVSPKQLRQTPKPTPTRTPTSSSTVTPSSEPPTSSNMPTTTPPPTQNGSFVTPSHSSGSGEFNTALAGFVGSIAVMGGIVLLFFRRIR